MKIGRIIDEIKKYHRGLLPDGSRISPDKTRDQVLYGSTDTECTGIVTCIYASVDVIRQAAKKGVNLIVCHEALFWNHGDHTEWLKENTVYQEKEALLRKAGITVWRNHDYVHSGIPLKDGSYIDGIFYGLADFLGWTSYMINQDPLNYRILETRADVLAKFLKEKLHYNGIRLVGNRDSMVSRIWIPGHILGKNDNDKISKIDQENIECILAYEMVDFTVAEYIRDAGMLGKNRVIISLGHFNGEEPGMRYMETYLRSLFPDIPIMFLPCGDMFEYE